MKNIFLAVVTIALLSSCAVKYNVINPRSSLLTTYKEESGVRLGSSFKILSETDNNRYAVNAEKNNLKVVLINITNNSGQPLEVNKTLVLTVDGKPVPIGYQTIGYRKTKQNPWTAALYSPALAAPAALAGNSVTLIAGAAVAAFDAYLIVNNVMKANKANKNYLAELQQYDLIGKTIQPKDSAYGIVFLKDIPEGELSVKVFSDANQAAQLFGSKLINLEKTSADQSTQQYYDRVYSILNDGDYKDKVKLVMSKFENGQISKIGLQILGDETINVGYWYTYYMDGKLASTEFYDQEGNRHGTFQYFKDDGTLKNEVKYDHGLLIK